MNDKGNPRRGGAVEWAMRYHSVVLLIACCLLAFGAYSLSRMNKNEFPDFTIRQGLVIGVMPGKGALDVERELTKPLEEFIFGYGEVRKEKTKSMSRDGLSIIQVELNADIADKDAFWNKFKHGLEAFRQGLPSSVLAVLANDDFGDTSAILLTIESADRTYAELKGIAEGLRDRLRGVEEVGRMTILGDRKEQVSVCLDQDRLAHYGVSMETLAMTLFSKGFTTTGGVLRGGDLNVPIRVAQSMNVEADVGNLVVLATPAGGVVRLRDVATVRREYPRATSMITNNGAKCLLLSIEMKKGRSITDMGAKVDRVLDECAVSLPPDVTMFKITDQPHLVGHSVTEFLGELLIAVLAVMVVVMLLLPLRVALVASSTIPITIFISLGFFYAFGIELNTVTLAGLVCTLGMIVDNSIVIIDAYMEDLGRGHERVGAAIGSAKRFFRSILTATLAISITFFPLLITMHGTFRDFLSMFPYAITLVLAVSLLVAELLVPFMLSRFIGTNPSAGVKDGKGSRREAFDAWLQGSYERLVERCFSHPRVTLGVGVGCVLVAALLVPAIPMRLMPTADRNQFAVEMYLPTGTPLSRTIEVADSVEAILAKDGRVVSIAAFKGCSSPRFQTSYAPQIPDENYAQFIVNTRSNKATVGVLDDFSHLCDSFPEAYVRFKQLDYSPVENPVEVRLAGFDIDSLRRAAGMVSSLMLANADLWMVRSDFNEPLVTAVATLDEDKAGRLGVSNASLELALASRYSSGGIPVATLWEGDRDIDVCLKGSMADGGSIDGLGRELIPVMAGLGYVPLRDLASVSTGFEYGQVCHRGGMPTVTVMADPRRGTNCTSLTGALIRDIGKLDLPGGVKVSYGGEWESNLENLPALVSGLCIAAVMIFFLLVAHYRNVGLPLLLLLGLSLTLVGTVASVFLQGIDFGVTCFLGVISLMGILVRNAIIMFDYAGELRSGGMDLRTAILTSAKRRMHPIFLTSAAASMGVIPMIIGGSGLWMPMGVVVCYGTLITMLFILTVLPVAYWKTQGKQAHETDA